MRRIIGPNASGALKAELELGEFVVCDQFVDRTSGRADTFYDGPETTHVSAADPYCPDLRAPARRDRPGARDPGAGRRHGGRHPGPALLDPCRVEVVPGRRLGHDQHDRISGGLPRARARALLREHLHGHRPRRRRRGHGSRSRTIRWSRSSTRTTSACASSSSRSSRRSRRSPRSTCAPRLCAEPRSRCSTGATRTRGWRLRRCAGSTRSPLPVPTGTGCWRSRRPAWSQTPPRALIAPAERPV